MSTELREQTCRRAGARSPGSSGLSHIEDAFVPYTQRVVRSDDRFMVDLPRWAGNLEFGVVLLWAGLVLLSQIER
jgi:hypothetical protein